MSAPQDPQVINGQVEPAVEIVLTGDNGDRIRFVVTGFSDRDVLLAAMRKLGDDESLNRVADQFKPVVPE